MGTFGQTTSGQFWPLLTEREVIELGPGYG
jgi:hypothetical protein